MKATATNATLKFWHDNGKLKPELTLSLTDHPEQIQNTFLPLVQAIEKGKKLSVTVEPARKKRSLDANAYLWVLCQKIAEALHTTREEIYKKFIRDVGQFEILPIREEAVDHWMTVWQSRGLGWHAEVIDDSKIPGYKKVINFYGSSCYNTKEMSILLDEVVTQAKELGIETLPPDELEAIKQLWGDKNASQVD